MFAENKTHSLYTAFKTGIFPLVLKLSKKTQDH